jgi:hypothetical protein
MQDLNKDEQAFFQKTFYGNIDPQWPVLQEQGCPSRSNPKGLRRFLQPKKKKTFSDETVYTTDPFLQYCPCRQLPLQPTFHSGPTTLGSVQGTRINVQSQ